MNINLIKEFALTDFKLRYQGSSLGYLWSFFKPLLMFTTLYLIFSIFLRFDIDNYPVFLFLGVIFWNFFIEASTSSIKNIVYNRELIRKFYFPRDSIVLASVLSAFITLFLNLLVFIVFFAISGIPLSGKIFLFPVFLAELFLVVLGLSFAVSAFNVKFRDLSHIWEILLQVGFWLTPIIYSVQMIPQKYHFAIYLNPLTRIIQYSREVVINGKFPELDGIIASVIMSIFVFWLGYFIFKKREPFFAEEL